MPHHTVTYSIRNEIRENLTLSIPFIASQLIYASSGFIGTAMVARLGEDALAASVLVSTIWMSLSVLFFGLLNSVSVLVSHQYGAKNDLEISKIMGQSFLLGILVSILIILLFLTVPFFLHITTLTPSVRKIAIEYVHALIWTIPALVLLIIYEQFLAGINRAKMVLRISLSVVPIEIPIIYLLIFGKFGLPQCDVAGIGYGFAITYSATAIVLTIYFLKSKIYKRFGLFSQIRKLDFACLKELIGIGLPMGFMHVIEVSTFTILTFWMARFGTTVLAAHQIALQYLGFVITIIFAMSQAVTVRVGHAVGRLDLTGIRYAVYVGMILNFICITLIAILFYIFPGFFLSLDIDVHLLSNAELVNIASNLLGISGALMIFDNFRIVGFGALRGIKDTKYPMFVSFISFWLVGLSLSFLLGFTFRFNAPGVWWGITLGIGFGALLIFTRIQYLLKRIDLKKLMKLQTIPQKSSNVVLG